LESQVGILLSEAPVRDRAISCVRLAVDNTHTIWYFCYLAQLALTNIQNFTLVLLSDKAKTSGGENRQLSTEEAHELARKLELLAAEVAQAPVRRRGVVPTTVLGSAETRFRQNAASLVGPLSRENLARVLLASVEYTARPDVPDADSNGGRVILRKWQKAMNEILQQSDNSTGFESAVAMLQLDANPRILLSDGTAANEIAARVFDKYQQINDEAGAFLTRRGRDPVDVATPLANEELIKQVTNPLDLIKVFDAFDELIDAKLRFSNQEHPAASAGQQRFRRAVRMRSNYEIIGAPPLSKLEQAAQDWLALEQTTEEGIGRRPVTR